jgi:hypothetical protein
MNTINLKIRYRPVKIGWCVRDDNFEDYRKALRFTHTLWGGVANPIIPIANEDDVNAAELVKHYEVDLLYPLANENYLTNFIRKFDHLPFPLFVNDLFFQSSDAKLPLFLDAMQAAHRYSFDAKKDVTDLTFYTVEWKEDDPLANVFEAMFGSYPKPEDLNLSFCYKSNVMKMLQKNQAIYLLPDQEIFSHFLPLTINSLTQWNLWPQLNAHILPRPGFYVGDANCFSDLVNFWNLKTCGIPLVFYDMNFHSRFSDLINVHQNEFLEKWPDRYSDPNSIGIWTQKDASMFSNIFSSNLTVYRKETFLDKKHVARWSFKQEHNVLGMVSEGKNRNVTIKLPPRPSAENPFERLYQHHITSVDVIPSFLKESQSFSFPFLPKLNHYLHSCVSNSKGVRSQSEGLGIITSENEDILTMKEMVAEDLIKEIFKNSGIKVEYSDAGIKTSNLINRMGVLDNCKLFKIEGLLELIRKYGPKKHFSRSLAINMIGQVDYNNKFHFDKYKKLSLLDHKKEINQDDVFVWLTKNGVLRAGLELKCTTCKLKFWIKIDDLKSTNQCEYCDEFFEILSQLEDKEWSYKFSGILGDDGHQGGGIPVAMILQQLSKSFSHDIFMYVTSMCLIPDGANINECESDFIIITWDRTGKISIVLSECKESRRIADKDIVNLKKVADTLNGNGIDTYVLFFKMNSFSKNEIRSCLSINEPYRYRTILLTKEDLETDVLCEQTKEITFLKRHGVSWENLAQYTHDTYTTP